MQSLKSISSADTTSVKNEVVKLDRILRLFRCYKNNDSSDIEKVKDHCQKILGKIQSLCPEKYF